MNRRDVKLLSPHVEGCEGVRAVRDGRWSNPWGTWQERAEWRDRRGTTRATTCAWLVMRCNDPDCSAEVMVRADAILDVIEALIPTPRED